MHQFFAKQHEHMLYATHLHALQGTQHKSIIGCDMNKITASVYVVLTTNWFECELYQSFSQPTLWQNWAIFGTEPCISLKIYWCIFWEKKVRAMFISNQWCAILIGSKWVLKSLSPKTPIYRYRIDIVSKFSQNTYRDRNRGRNSNSLLLILVSRSK